MKSLKVANLLSLVFAACMVIVSLSFAYVLLVPLDVIKNWQIRIDQKAYRPGDELVLHVSYQKLRETTGKAFYYLECKNPKGSLVRYPISQSEGNRPKGSGATDVPIKLPDQISNLPAPCRIAVSVDYTIYTFRKFVENNSSNYFTVRE